MELTLDKLNVEKENLYFTLALIISVVAWIFISIAIVRLVIGLVVALFIWIGNGLLVAQLKSDCVQVNDRQLPLLFNNFKDVCQKFNLQKIPELYILQSGGLLNAFAMRHAGRDFVVLFSEIVEAYDLNSEEIRFLLGHEIGHIRSRHILKHILVFPALILPLLGPAYKRACEISCDRFGAFATNDVTGAIKAMMILSGGRQLGKTLDSSAFSEQSKTYRGFFVSWYELISGYPTLSQRVASLISLKDGVPLRYSRNPLAYFFALFSFGGRGGVDGNIFITAFMVGLLATIAIPNFVKARLTGNEALAKQTLQIMASAAKKYADEHLGEFPSDVSELLKATPPYLKQDYCNKRISGYLYECHFEKDDFKFKATPLIKRKTGVNEFFVTKEGLSIQKQKERKFKLMEKPK